MVDEHSPAMVTEKVALGLEMQMAAHSVGAQPVDDKIIEVVVACQVLRCPLAVLVIPTTTLEVGPGRVKAVPGIASKGKLEVAVEIPPTKDDPILRGSVVVRQRTKQAVRHRGAGGFGDVDKNALALVEAPQRKDGPVVNIDLISQLPERIEVALL